jgi:heme/copper-type cytochrome/quinol oxidase subunit 1
VPATGMISMILPVFARRRLAGYFWIVTSLVAIGFISFGVWVHHMFATGMPVLAMSFFSAASLVIVIPSGIQFFAWISTMWHGVVEFPTPMLYALGFLLIFLAGGITGVMVAVMPFDWQITDSYFVVAHFHYVLNGAVVFPIFGAIYFWMPKMTGRMLDERLGKISFWTMFVGFNLAFFPMHILGLLGMPRRVYTYESGLGWGPPNVLATIGGFMFGLGALLTLINFVKSRRSGEEAGPNPWKADTLEWAIASPAPHYNFAAIPMIESRHPLWEPTFRVTTSGDDEATAAFGEEGAEERSTPITAGMRADPEETMEVPEETVLPFVLALGIAIFFYGLLIEAALVGVIGVLLGIVGITWWAWRTGEQ